MITLGDFKLRTFDDLKRRAIHGPYRLPVVISARRYEHAYSVLLRLRWWATINRGTLDGAENFVDRVDEIGDALHMRRRFSGVGNEVLRPFRLWPWAALTLAMVVGLFLTVVIYRPLLPAVIAAPCSIVTGLVLGFIAYQVSHE